MTDPVTLPRELVERLIDHASAERAEYRRLGMHILADRAEQDEEQARAILSRAGEGEPVRKECTRAQTCEKPRPETR